MNEKNHTELEIKNLMAHSWGRNFLRRLLFQHTRVFHSPHHPEAGIRDYQAGVHAVGLLVLNEILEAEPSALTVLLQEEKEENVQE